MYIKLLAMLTMFIDHSGAIILKDMELLRIIGRLSLPMFAFGIAQGYVKTKKLTKYVLRLLLLAFISQFVYQIRHDSLNIIYTFLFSLMIIYVYDKLNNEKLFSRYKLLLQYVLIISILIISNYLKVEYGIYAVMIPFIFFVFKNNKLKMLLNYLILTLVYSFSTGAYIQLYSLIALPLIFYIPNVKYRLKRPFYLFYPAHLLFLIILAKLLRIN